MLASQVNQSAGKSSSQPADGQRPAASELSLVFRNAERSPVKLTPGKWTIGSDSANRIELTGQGIERRHAMIVASDRRVLLTSWAAGTFINGKPVNDAELHSGDVLQIGNAFCAVCKTDQRDLLGRVDELSLALDLLQHELHGDTDESDRLDQIVNRIEADLAARNARSESPELNDAGTDHTCEVSSPDTESIRSFETSLKNIAVTGDDDLRVSVERQRLESLVRTFEHETATGNIDSQELCELLVCQVSRLVEFTESLQSRAAKLDEHASELSSQWEEVHQLRQELQAARDWQRSSINPGPLSTCFEPTTTEISELTGSRLDDQLLPAGSSSNSSSISAAHPDLGESGSVTEPGAAGETAEMIELASVDPSVAQATFGFPEETGVPEEDDSFGSAIRSLAPEHFEAERIEFPGIDEPIGFDDQDTIEMEFSPAHKSEATVASAADIPAQEPVARDSQNDDTIELEFEPSPVLQSEQSKLTRYVEQIEASAAVSSDDRAAYELVDQIDEQINDDAESKLPVGALSVGSPYSATNAIRTRDEAVRQLDELVLAAQRATEGETASANLPGWYGSGSLWNHQTAASSNNSNDRPSLPDEPGEPEEARDPESADVDEFVTESSENVAFDTSTEFESVSDLIEEPVQAEFETFDAAADSERLDESEVTSFQEVDDAAQTAAPSGQDESFCTTVDDAQDDDEAESVTPDFWANPVDAWTEQAGHQKSEPLLVETRLVESSSLESGTELTGSSLPAFGSFVDEPATAIRNAFEHDPNPWGELDDAATERPASIESHLADAESAVEELRAFETGSVACDASEPANSEPANSEPANNEPASNEPVAEVPSTNDWEPAAALEPADEFGSVADLGQSTETAHVAASDRPAPTSQLPSWWLLNEEDSSITESSMHEPLADKAGEASSMDAYSSDSDALPGVDEQGGSHFSDALDRVALPDAEISFTVPGESDDRADKFPTDREESMSAESSSSESVFEHEPPTTAEPSLIAQEVIDLRSQLHAMFDIPARTDSLSTEANDIPNGDPNDILSDDPAESRLPELPTLSLDFERDADFDRFEPAGADGADGAEDYPDISSWMNEHTDGSEDQSKDDDFEPRSHIDDPVHAFEPEPDPEPAASGHMNAPQAESPFVAEVAGQPARTEPSPKATTDDDWDATDPDSISAYMQQLLARNRRKASGQDTHDPVAPPARVAATEPRTGAAGASSGRASESSVTGVEQKSAAATTPGSPSTSTAAQLSVSSGTDATHTAAADVATSAAQSLSRSTIAAEANFEPENASKSWLEEGPRHRLDKQQLRAEVKALREVANHSARSAVAVSSRKQLRIQVIVKTLASVLSMAFGVIALNGGLPPVSAYGVFGIGLFFAGDLCLTVYRTRSSLGASPANQPDEE